MSDLVPAEDIERIVGLSRHSAEHYGRAVSEEQTVYILHSQECRDSTPDLRECPYSIALDRGIDGEYPWAYWCHAQDRPVPLEISRRGYLLPKDGDQ